MASVSKLYLWDVPEWRNENDFYLFAFLFISDNSFGHIYRLSKLMVCTQWRSEPMLPTHYVSYFSACLLVWPRIMGTMLNGSSVWHYPCLFPDFQDKIFKYSFIQNNVCHMTFIVSKSGLFLMTIFYIKFRNCLLFLAYFYFCFCPILKRLKTQMSFEFY